MLDLRRLGRCRARGSVRRRNRTQLDGRSVRSAVSMGTLLASAFIATGPALAQQQACCDLSSKNRACYDDLIGKGATCPFDRSLGKGTTCAMHCQCGGNCNSCASKASGDQGQFEVQYLGSFFDSVNTIFTYQVCEHPTSLFTLQHWTLELTPTCCERFVSATGGVNQEVGCSADDPEVIDPFTGLAGIVFEVSNIPLCDGVCGPTGELFTVTLSGNVGTGCTRAGNRTSGSEVATAEREAISTVCIVGPSCAPLSACCDHSQPGGVCVDNIDEIPCNNTAGQPEFFDGLSCDQVEALLLCQEHTGACCDHAQPGGVCVDGIPESVCLSQPGQPEFFKGLTCADVELAGFCDEQTGACCDHAQPGGVCVDGIAESACVGDQAEFFKGMTCTDVENLGFCQEHTGACCDASVPGGQCTDGVIGSLCVGDQITYYKGLLCADLNPPCTEHVGACCDHAQPGGLCVDGIPGSVCMTGMGLEQPEFFKGLTCADVELAGLCEEHTGACCDHALPDGACLDNVAESLCLAAAEQPDFFKGMTCADVENLGLCTEHTGACCDRAQVGGVCIEGVVESACTGIQEQFFKGLTCTDVENAGFCEEHTGACCEHSTPDGTCVDGVAESVCLSSGLQPQFFKGATCADVENIGACGEHIGACCDQRVAIPALRCRDDIPESQCVIDDPNQVTWTKGVQCADLDPPCTEHTGACCDRRILDPLLRCRDQVPNSECIIDDIEFVSWTKGVSCDDLNPPCEPVVGACCDSDPFGGCAASTVSQCTCASCTFYPGLTCEGITCTQNSIPAVSDWGLVVLTLLMLTAAKVRFDRRHIEPA